MHIIRCIVCRNMYYYVHTYELLQKKGKRKKNLRFAPLLQSSKKGAEEAFFDRSVIGTNIDIIYIYIYINELIENKIAPSVPFSHRGLGPSRFKCMERGELPGAISSKVAIYIYIYIYSFQ